MKTFVLSPLTKSMLMAFAGFSLWAFTDALIRFLRDYPTELIAFLASVVSVLFYCIFSRQLGGFHKTFTQPKLALRIFRGFLLSISGVLGFTVFTELELPTAYALIFMAPFWVKILSVVVMKETIRLRSWLITALGFIGVLIVLRPGIVAMNIGSISAIALTFFFASGYVLARYIGKDNQTALSLSIFGYFFITLWTAYPAYMAYQDLPPELLFSWFELFLIFLIGALACAATPLVGHAFASAPSAYIAPIHYVQMVWGMFWGVVLFSEYPDIWTVAGGSVIIFAGLLLIRYSRAES